MTKNNPNLSDQQKKVLFEEATEAPGSSELNFEKRDKHLQNFDDLELFNFR